MNQWESEPDAVDFKHAGLQCRMRRNGGGAWCGYVRVGKDHPAFGKHYDNVDVDVHGGLTWADQGPGGGDGKKSSEWWWLGFDCSHYGDFTPKYDGRYGSQGYHSVYRDEAYVRHECESLAEQLAEMDS